MNGAGLVGSDLGRYMREIERHPLLSLEEEQRLARRWFDEGDVEAAKRLVLGNLRFSLKLALEYRRFGPLMDLVQEANLGLMEAVRRFNPYRGYRLITYAVWWIRAYLQRYVVESGSVVRRGTTRDQRTVVRKLGSARAALAAEGIVESPAELAEYMGVREDAVTAVTGSDLSLDMPMDTDSGEGRTMLDVLPAAGENAEEALIEAEQEALIRQALEDVMASLNERDREIMRMRLLAGEPATLQDLADRLSISRERVRQLESGLRKRLEKAVLAAIDREPRPMLPPAPEARRWRPKKNGAPKEPRPEGNGPSRP